MGFSLIAIMEENHAMQYYVNLSDSEVSGSGDHINVSSEFAKCPNTTVASRDINVGQAVVIGIILGLIICFTLIGNGLVVLAVASFQRLRSVTNMFIISLAIADITVAVLVMPFSLLFEIYGQWHFGWIFCYFWISCDVTCCTASILHLCVISLDRYLAITQPLTYKTRMSKRRAITMICGVWACSIAISFVPIFMGWFAYGDQDVCLDSTQCGLHNVNQVYAVISSSTSFFVPLIVMVVAYVKIFRIAHRQAQEIKKLECSLVLNNTSNGKKDKAKKRNRRVSRDAKAIKTLGILMGLFIICWLPFFLMYVIIPFCPSCAPPAYLVSIITWLGYINSFINPCVYAFLNRDFRMAFKKILSCGKGYPWCWCSRRKHRSGSWRVKRHEWDIDVTHNRDNSSSLCDNMVVENGQPREHSMNGSTASMIHHGLKVVDVPLQ